MTNEIYSKIQSGELKPSISDASKPLPENILVLVTQRKNDAYRTTEILTVDLAASSFDTDPANSGVVFTIPRFLVWRQRCTPEEIIVAHSVAKLL